MVVINWLSWLYDFLNDFVTLMVFFVTLTYVYDDLLRYLSVHTLNGISCEDGSERGEILSSFVFFCNDGVSRSSARFRPVSVNIAVVDVAVG